MHFEIKEYFSGIYGLDNFYAAGKAGVGKVLMKETGCKPGETVMIGDTTHDFNVAKELGISCILIPGGHHSRKRLENTGAAVMDSIAALK
jgi:phosphoglycolate phosphatase